MQLKTFISFDALW